MPTWTLAIKMNFKRKQTKENKCQSKIIKKKTEKKRKKESWFVLCDVTELHLWIERFCCSVLTQNTRHPARKTPPLLRFQPLRNDLLQDSRKGGERGRSRLNSIDTVPPRLTPFSHAHTLTPHVNTLGLWQRSGAYVSLCRWTPCSLQVLPYQCIGQSGTE